MRHHLTFPCQGATLAATLDPAPGTSGLLIVSGGNEIRSGAHRGMATLAQSVTAAGHPVFRFDRRGIGDSEGENGDYTSSAPDIEAAIASFRQLVPHMTRITAFGNCDAASALLLHQPLPVDALILANPWTYESDDAGDGDASEAPALPPAGAIRSRYLSRLKDPRSLLRLLKGEIDFRKLARGLSAMTSKAAPPAPNSLAAQLDRAMAALSCPATLLLATGDRTAQAFLEACHPANLPVERLDSSSHSFAGVDADWLTTRILEQLAPSP